jgi:predicted DNA-binding transcriptional regulator YafY
MAKQAARSTRGASRVEKTAARVARSRQANQFARSPFLRVVEIHRALQQEERFTAEAMAARLEVTSRTILRDIDLMRDHFGLPVEWDPGEHSYVYTRECDTLPLLRMNMDEALTLALAGGVSARVAGSVPGRMLAAMLDRVSPLFGGAVSVAAAAISRVFVPSKSADDREYAHFFTLMRPMLECRVVRLNYLKRLAAKAEEREVHPLLLTERDGGLVLVAHDPGRGGVRHFVLKRIQGIVTTSTTFAVPPGFDPKEHLGLSLGRFAGGQVRTVRLALDAEAAFDARETPWHPEQRLGERPDGRVELVMRLNHLADIRNLVLRWGAHVEVLAPAELRDEVREILRAALAHYAGPRPGADDVAAASG